MRNINSMVLHGRRRHAVGVNLRDSLRAAMVTTIWGINFLVIGWGMEGVPPLLFAAIRFTVVLLPAVFLVPRPDAPWPKILAVGTFMSLGQFAFLYSSMHAGMPPGIAALVLQAQVILTVVFAAGVLRERPSRRQAVGVAVGTVGLVVVGIGRGGHITLTALVLCLLAGVSWAIGNVVSRSSGIRGGLSLTVWSALVVPVPLFLLSLALDGPGDVADALAGFSWKSLVSTLYTAGLASLLGYAVFNGLLSRYAPASVVPWVLLAPVVAMAAAWLLLAQRPNAGETLGGAVLLLGVLVALRPPSSQKVLTRGAEMTVARESAGWARRTGSPGRGGSPCAPVGHTAAASRCLRRSPSARSRRRVRSSSSPRCSLARR